MSEPSVAPAQTILTDPPADPQDPPANPPADPQDPPANPPADPQDPPADPSADPQDPQDPPGAPDKYEDFTLPEGVELNNDALNEATELFKSSGLTQENAQKFVDFHTKTVQGLVTAQQEAFVNATKEWYDQSKTDSEFGGDKFDENVGVAIKAIETFGSPGLKELLTNYGIGNHPEMIRFALNVGKLLKEDNPGDTSGKPVDPMKSRIDILYPTNKG